VSRNLCRRNCHQCGSIVRLEDGPSWYDNNYHINLRKAMCIICGTKYAAWMDGPDSFRDLSYRSTINDEPGEDDIPANSIQTYKLVVVDGVPFVMEHEFD